jgi:hypothetical protein
MCSGKVIVYLGFSHRGVFIGEGASSKVDQGAHTTGRRGPGVGHAPWPPSGPAPSPLRSSGSSVKYLDVWLWFRPISRIFPVQLF